MEINELMIGDWMQITHHHNPKPIVKVEQVDLIVFRNALMQIYPRISYDPIPLTPEILEKNGFKYEEHHGFRISSDLLYVCIPKYDGEDYKEGLVPYTYITGGNSDYGDDGVYMYLNFVHELQHVLKLCGIEKEIVL